MDRALRWSLQAAAFLFAFWGISTLLGEPSLLWQEAVLIFIVYWTVTAIVEMLYGKMRRKG